MSKKNSKMNRLPFFFLLLVFLMAPQVWGATPLDFTSFANVAPGEVDPKWGKDFPVKVTFTSESGIHYGGIFVRVYDATGIDIFKELCEKPWLFLRLPEGDYHLIAVDRKKVQRIRPFHVKKKGQTLIKLTWPKEAAGY